MLNIKIKGKKINVISLILLISTSFIGIKLAYQGIKVYRENVPKVLVNQVGYFMWDGDKSFLVQHPTQLAGGEFQIINDNTGNSVLSGNLTYLGTLWNNHYWEGNFSTYNAPGTYHVKVTFTGYHKPVRSYPFQIGESVFDDAMKLGYEFFYYQRSGAKVVDDIVPGYVGHEYCYADDASFDNGTYRDVRGGWFDAGDYNKYNGLTTLSLLALVESYESFAEFYNTPEMNNTYPNSTGVDYHGNYPDILEEAIWGADFLVRCTTGSGMLYSKIGSNDFHGHYGYIGPPEGETDNNPDTFFDNRKLHYEIAGPVDGMRTSLGLLMLARVLNETGKFPARVQSYYDTAIALIGNYNASLGANHSMKALINMELYKITGDEAYRHVANIIGMDNLQNIARLNWNATGFGHIGVDDRYSYTMLWALQNNSIPVLNLAREKINGRWENF
ncbi:MAG: glycoside hydrolase family 9 protein, partial [Promethearchaeota archaeon]